MVERCGKRRGTRLVLLALGAALGVAGLPGTGGGARADEAGALLARYETCLGEEEVGICAALLTGFCLDLAADHEALSACRAALAEGLEARVAAMIDEIARNGGPAARRMALERARGAERSVARNCDAYAEATPQADTPHHEIRCALLAAHVKMIYVHDLHAALESRT